MIGFLTILGFSLYDTVVVFDKVDENTRGLSRGARMTCGEAANLAVNQTLMRSINTSVIALLPVAGLLFVGAGLLGVGTLKDLALVLFVGLAAGTYSSIFLATPIVADLKEREPEQIGAAQAGRSPAGPPPPATPCRRRSPARGAAPGGRGPWPSRSATHCPARSPPTSSSSRPRRCAASRVPAVRPRRGRERGRSGRATGRRARSGGEPAVRRRSGAPTARR